MSNNDKLGGLEPCKRCHSVHPVGYICIDDNDTPEKFERFIKMIEECHLTN